MAEYEILYWHDIPLQVRAGSRRDRVRQELPPRFQVAVDRAAMATGLTGTDEYLEGFHWSEAKERPGPAADVVTAVIAELEAAYPDVDWRSSVRALKVQGADETGE